MQENNCEQLEKILQSIAQNARPDNSFKQTLKARLNGRFYSQQESQKKEQRPASRVIWRWKIQFTSIIALVLLSSTTIYAYSRDDVTNGNILYPLKRSVENIEGLFATTPQAQTDYYNKMAKRRMDELTVLQDKGITDENTLKEADLLITKATKVAQEVPNDQVSTPPTIRIDQPIIHSSNGVALTQNIPAMPTIIPHVKTKRQKALEETFQIRQEFEEKFDRKSQTNDVVKPININIPPISDIPAKVFNPIRTPIITQIKEITIPTEIQPIKTNELPVETQVQPIKEPLMPIESQPIKVITAPVETEPIKEVETPPTESIPVINENEKEPIVTPIETPREPEVERKDTNLSQQTANHPLQQINQQKNTEIEHSKTENQTKKYNPIEQKPSKKNDSNE